MAGVKDKQTGKKSVHGGSLGKAVFGTEKTYSELFEYIGDVVLLADLDANIIDINNSVRRYGFKKKDLLGKKYLKLVPRKDREQLVKDLSKLKGGKKTQGVTEVITPKGRVFVEFNSTPIKEDGKVAGFLSILRDVTEQKKALAKLKSSEEKYRNLFDSEGGGVLLIDKKGKILEANKRVINYSGYKAKDLVGKNFLSFVPKKQWPFILKEQLKLMKSKRGTIYGETEILVPGGSIICSYSAGRVEEDGKTTGFLVTLTDITDQKKAEEALKKSEEKYRNLFESGGGGVLLIDMRGRILEVNHRLIEHTGYKEKDIVGKNFLSFVPKKQWPFILKKQLELRRSKRGTIYGETEVLVPAGRMTCSYSAGRVEEDGKMVGLLVSLIDITDQKRAEEAQKKSERKYKELFDSAGDGIVICDRKGTILDTNKASLAYQGGKRENVVGKNFLSFVPKKQWPSIIKDMPKLWRGKSVQGSISIITPKGVVDAEYTASPIREGRKIVGFQGVLRDVTEKRKAEEALKKSEEKYRELFDNAGDTIIITDKKGTITDVNRAVEKYRFKEGDLIGESFLKLAPKSNWQYLLKNITNVWKGKSTQGETEVLTPAGKKYVAFISTPMREGGKVVGVLSILRDITEEKKAEEALKKSEERYRELFDNAGDGIIICDKKGTTLEVNKAVENYGFKRKDMIGKNFLKFVSKKNWPFLTKDVLNLWRGKNTHGEIEVITPTGIVNAEFNSTPIRENGKVVGFLSILRDIRERVKASQEKRESEERYRHIFDNARDPIITMDLSGKILDVNKAIEGYGFKKGNLIGKNYLKLVPKKQWPAMMKDLLVSSTGKPVQREIDLVTPKGTYVMMYRASPIKERGKITAIQTTLIDVTERRRAEEAVRESEKRYRFLVNNSNEIILVIDMKGRILFANKTALDTIGGSQKDLIGSSMFKFLPKDAYKKAFKALIGEFFGQHHGRFELPVITLKGERRYLEFAPGSTPVFRGGKAIGILVNAIDVTYRKEAERERLELYKMKELDKMKDDMFSMTAHELKTPMTPIKLESDMWLAGVYGKLSARQRKSVKSIERNTGRLINLINDIMTITKIEQEKLKYKFERIRLNGLLSDIGSDMIAEAQEKGIYLKTRIPDEPVYVMGDKTRIVQVIANLITNAIKFTDKGGVTLEMKVEGKLAKISVRDTGWGISEIDKPHVFEKYFKSQTHSIGKGLGLGLPISKGIIERHGGKMWFESQEGKGTTFYFTIPLYKGSKVNSTKSDKAGK